MSRISWRRLHGWWLITIAAAISAAASLLASSLPMTVGAILVSVVSGVAGIITVRAERAIEAGPTRTRQLYTSVRGKAPLVREIVDPLTVGVHPAPALPGSGGTDRCPPFVSRERSKELEEALLSSRFVLVVGESTAGKTRAAYEAMRTMLPDHTFIRPRHRSTLAAALDASHEYRKCVVWLNDLELYLGPDGLTADMISPLLADGRRHIVVLATMRSHERARYTLALEPDLGDGQGGLLRTAGEVLGLALEIRLDRIWSQDERARASAHVADRRIAAALRHAQRFGVAQYLAAGPQLFAAWQDAKGSWPEGRPRGAALVAAAVDIRRSGHHRPVPIAFLRDLHEVYLAEVRSAGVRLESWEEAVRWATTPLHSTSSLLIPVADDGYVAFDYLPDAADAAAGVPDIPLPVWDKVISHVSPEDAIEVGWGAFLRGRPMHGEAALHKALAAGYYRAAIELSYTLGDTYRKKDVTSWLESALASAEEHDIPAEDVIKLRTRLVWWTGMRYEGVGDPHRARELGETVVADSARLLGDDHPRTLWSRLTLARQVGATGDAERALAMACQVHDHAHRLPNADQLLIRAARFEIAVWVERSGRSRLWETAATRTPSHRRSPRQPRASTESSMS
ncbi:tetratricopeptide repeat protein [[Actinomadura] parvosata]|uniref:tetratricopeptide repeat protein n=2 Tax=[Actinomadura] parvosata TaxID=1955412 RepID=UPI0009AE41A6